MLLTIRRSAAVALIGAGVLTGLATPAHASTSSGTVAATINVAPPLVRSVTVSTTSVTFASCTNGTDTATASLTLPNGVCDTPNGITGPPISITNGDAAGHIQVSGSSAIPSDNGTAWNLCDTSSCTGSSSRPGVDQFQLTVLPAGTAAQEAPLTPTPACDKAFDETSTNPMADCAAAAHQAANEYLELIGPSATSDAAPSFTTSVTWIAVP